MSNARSGRDPKERRGGPASPISVPLVAATVLLSSAVSSCTDSRSLFQDNVPHRRGTRESLLEGNHVVRSLVDESTRAELRSLGLLVHFDDGDLHKYDLGGFGGWLRIKRKSPNTCVEVGRAASLSFHDFAGKIRSVLVRARSSVPAQQLQVEIDGRTVGKKPLQPDWKTVELQVPFEIAAGRRSVTLTLEKAPKERDEHAGRADVEWIWFRTRSNGKATVPPNPEIVKELTYGKKERSLVANAPRSYSYYLEVPRGGAFLLFDYAARRPTQFEVVVRAEGHEPRVLNAFEASGLFKPARVGLSDFAGRLIQLELVTRGPGGPAAWGEPVIAVAGPLPKAAPVSKGSQATHLVQVVVDNARQDAYQPFAPSSKVETPALVSLAKRGAIFAAAYADSSSSLPSVASLLSGRHFTTFLDDTSTGKVPAEVPLLAEQLKARGFSTAAFAASPFVSAPFGLARGFDTLVAKQSTDSAALYAEAIEWLKTAVKSGKRLYLYVHAMDPHPPWVYRDSITEKIFGGAYKGELGKTFTVEDLAKVGDGGPTLGEEDRRWVSALYLGGVAYHDKQLGRLLDELSRLKILDKTLVVYSNAHGEELFDHDRVDHGSGLFDTEILSPLVVSYPKLFLGGSVDKEAVELVDVVPTVLEVLGLPKVPALHGTSLLESIAGVVGPCSGVATSAGTARAVRIGNFKLVQQPGGGVQLFDLIKDPAEKVDLAATSPIARRACEIALGEAVAFPAKSSRLSGRWPETKPLPRQSATLDAELKKQLKALGYLR